MEAAEKAGISKFCLPNIDVESLPAMQELVNNYPGKCFPMLGLHPCSVKEDYRQQLRKIEYSFPKFHPIAVGEIGIDLYWDKSTLDKQVEAFETQIGWAKEKGLPIVIHARDSFEEIFAVLDRLHDEKLSGVFHCFTGGRKEMEKALSYANFYLGIGGVVTFRNGGLDQVVPHIPHHRLLLETDAPYLSPAPYGGKRNEPAYLRLIAEKVAELYQLSLEEVAGFSSRNAEKLFNLQRG